jgi:hypothetical protein
MLLQDVRKTVSTFITYNSLKVVLVTRSPVHNSCACYSQTSNLLLNYSKNYYLRIKSIIYSFVLPL